MTTLSGYQDTPTGRAISELAALLAKECPLEALLGAVQRTDGDPLREIFIPSGPCVVCGEPTVLQEWAWWDEYGQPWDKEYRCWRHRRRADYDEACDAV